MKKITFAIMGMGNRGTAYAAKALKYPEEMEITAMADTRRVRLDAANKYLNLPEDRLFDSAEALLSQPKLADIMVVATQDAQHKDHAIRAMELGYDLLLEKPISPDLERLMDERSIYQYKSGSSLLPLTGEVENKYVLDTVAPILSEGDVLGCVVFAGDPGQLGSGEVEYKLAQSIAAFLGKHMEF